MCKEDKDSIKEEKHGESQYFKGTKTETKISKIKQQAKQVTLPIISEERDRMTVGRYKNGD